MQKKKVFGPQSSWYQKRSDVEKNLRYQINSLRKYNTFCPNSLFIFTVATAWSPSVTFVLCYSFTITVFAIIEQMASQQKMLTRHNVEDIQAELVKKLLLKNILSVIIFFWIHLIILSYVVCFSQVMKESSLVLTLLSINTYLISCKTSTTSIAEEYNSSSSTKRYTYLGPWQTSMT